jgi:hypothetical protein
MSRLVPKNRTPCKNWWRDSQDPIHKKKKKKKVHQHWSVLITKRYSNHPTFAVERSCRVGLSSNQKEIGAIHAREKEVLPIISRFLVCFFLLSKAFLTV